MLAAPVRLPGGPLEDYDLGGYLDELLGGSDGVVRVLGPEPADLLQFGVDTRCLRQGVDVDGQVGNARRVQAQLVVNAAKGGRPTATTTSTSPAMSRR